MLGHEHGIDAIAQAFIDTGPHARKYRILTLFGEPLYAEEISSVEETPMPADLKVEIQGAIERIAVPAPTSTNASQVAAARRTRVNAAVFLTLVSPEFLVQK